MPQNPRILRRLAPKQPAETHTGSDSGANPNPFSSRPQDPGNEDRYSSSPWWQQLNVRPRYQIDASFPRLPTSSVPSAESRPPAAAHPEMPPPRKPLPSGPRQTNGGSGSVLAGDFHKVSEDELRDRQCHICGKVMANRSSLMRHCRNHLGVKPYACSQCNASFGSWSTWNVSDMVEHDRDA